MKKNITKIDKIKKTIIILFNNQIKEICLLENRMEEIRRNIKKISLKTINKLDSVLSQMKKEVNQILDETENYGITFEELNTLMKTIIKIQNKLKTDKKKYININ
jgi:K+/H+ antiporter YhaU regulatory subunit KhtT